MTTMTATNNAFCSPRFLVNELQQNQGRLATALPAGAWLVALLVGVFLVQAEIPEQRPIQDAGPVRIKVSHEKVVLPVVAVPEPKTEIPVLEPQTILATPVDRPVPERKETPAVTPQTTPVEKQPEAPVRRVYGVRKVYARGLGTGGQSSPGLVTKQGNTLDGVADTLKATEADLRGELASLSSIDQAPQPLRRIKPVYSKEMRKAKAHGLVTAYLLVDTDGSVKDVKITQDIGFDSRQVATTALRGFVFKPAMKDGNPVAVWILHRIRFEIQE